MPETQTQTAEKLRTLLDILNITVVYYVDDENHLTDFDIQILTGEIEKVYSLQREEELKQIELEGWNRDLPMEGVIEYLRTEWENIPFDDKKVLYIEILRISGGEDIKLDFERAARIGEQIPQGLIKVLSPQEWDEEKKSLANKIQQGERALILFDEDLKHAGGQYTSIRGQDLIVQVKNMGVNDKVICSLLTHKISSAKEELGFRNEIIEKREGQDLAINDFFPLAKQRLDQPEVFADGIKKTLLNKYFETIKKHTIDLIDYSYGKAKEKIKSFDTYDFDDTILQSSVKEGIWEPETIMRISDIVFHNELKKRMVETDYVSKVNRELKASQKFSEIQFSVPENMQPYSDKLTIRHHEIYDPSEIINALRKPLENGDIFQIDGKKFVLVAQPCDMMVRGKGDKKGLRNARIATLLKIDEKDFTKSKLSDTAASKDKYPLTYFMKGTKALGIVEFPNFIVVDIDLLDLCVFNETGESKFDLGNPIVNREYLSSIWEKRFDILIEKFSAKQQKVHTVKQLLTALQPDQIQVILSEFYPKLIIASSIDIHSVVTANEQLNSFDFGIKRVMTYKEPGSTRLLEKYMQFLSRDAEPHDFAMGESQNAIQQKVVVQKKIEHPKQKRPENQPNELPPSSEMKATS